MPAKTAKAKKSPLREFFSWTIDLTLLGLLIWYFSSGQNTARFWSTAANWFNQGVVVVFQLAAKLPSNKKPSASQHQTFIHGSMPPPMFVPPPLPTPEQFAKEVAGDCFPPEAHSAKDIELTNLFYQPPPLPKTKKVRTGHGKPVQFVKRKIKGVPFYQLTIDLKDPDSYLVIRLPHGVQRANSTTYTAGSESFDSFVKRYPAAAVINGTFFSKDNQQRVMGNMVSEGKSLKYSQWENYGTTLSLTKGDAPEMVTARDEGVPNFDNYWFSLTCGPRLLKHGEVWVYPEVEGFTDSHVLGIGPRSAIGFPKSKDKLYLIIFLRGLSLKEEAKLMKAIGCYEAMNIDGGASKALSHDDNAVIKPGRPLTNVLVVYDTKHKAPENVIASWQQFQDRSHE